MKWKEEKRKERKRREEEGKEQEKGEGRITEGAKNPDPMVGHLRLHPSHSSGIEEVVNPFPSLLFPSVTSSRDY